MKKVFYFSLMVMTMFLMTACSSSGPGDAMKKYGNYLIKGDYEKFVDGLAFDESVGAEKMKEQKDGLVSMLKEKVSKEYEKMDSSVECKYSAHIAHGDKEQTDSAAQTKCGQPVAF